MRRKSRDDLCRGAAVTHPIRLIATWVYSHRAKRKSLSFSSRPFLTWEALIRLPLEATVNHGCHTRPTTHKKAKNPGLALRLKTLRPTFARKRSRCPLSNPARILQMKNRHFTFRGASRISSPALKNRNLSTKVRAHSAFQSRCRGQTIPQRCSSTSSTYLLMTTL